MSEETNFFDEELENREEQDEKETITESILQDEELINQSKELQAGFDVFLKNNESNITNMDNNIRIPTGIDLLDTLLGGGFSTNFTQLVGEPGSGKSALAARVLANAQRIYKGKFIGIYADSEEATTEERLAQLGVTKPKIKPYTGLTVERVFKLVETLCSYKANSSDPEILETPSVIVWDSIANTLTETGMVEENINSTIGQKARLLSHLLPKYVQKMNRYRIALVGVNQLREQLQMGQFAPPPTLKFLANKNIPGGQASLYNASQILYIRAKNDLKDLYGFDGVRVEGNFVKNKSFSPNIKFTMVFSFKKGFSNFWTNYELLKDAKRINASAWCSLKSYPELKFRQKEVYDTYKNNEEFRKAWDEDVKDVIKNEYILKSENNLNIDEQSDELF